MVLALQLEFAVVVPVLVLCTHMQLNECMRGFLMSAMLVLMHTAGGCAACELWHVNGQRCTCYTACTASTITGLAHQQAVGYRCSIQQDLIISSSRCRQPAAVNQIPWIFTRGLVTIWYLASFRCCSGRCTIPVRLAGSHSARDHQQLRVYVL